VTPANPFERGRAPAALRLLEGTGGLLRAVGFSLPPLDEHELCAAASRRTRLTDFGDERFRPLLRQMIGAFQDGGSEDTRFLRGLVARVYLLKSLRNRLQIEAKITQHPEILATPVPRPLVIIGLGRTGTTLLLNLLSQDPGSRSLLINEGLSPAEPLGLRQVERLVWFVNRFIPQLRAIYIVEPEAPVECGMLFRNTFLPHDATARDSRHWRDRFSPETWEWAYREFYRQLQLLEWQRPTRDHWLLKWPQHVYSPDILVKTIPDVTMVQTHRDPGHVVSAILQMMGRFAYLFSETRWKQMPGLVLELTAELLHRSIAARERVPSHRIFDVSYTRLTSDPIAVLRDLYGALGYAYTDQFERRARSWLEHHPAPKRAESYHDLAQFGLDQALIERTFAFYNEKFGLKVGA
jgi:Sulfotransferase family